MQRPTLDEPITDLTLEAWGEVCDEVGTLSGAAAKALIAEVRRLRADAVQRKAHLEYLRCAIVYTQTEAPDALGDDMDVLWDQMDQTTRDIVNRDVKSLVDE